MIRILACFFVWGIVATSAWAQFNPYGQQRGAAVPVMPDGTLNWPTFFKSPQLEAKFQALHELGSCRGTKMSINMMLENNKIHINQLNEAQIVGRVLAADAGFVAMVDQTGRPLTLITHPAGVTKINVTGKIPATALQAGMSIRLSAGVDEHSQGLERVEALDVITPTPDVKPKAVEPGRVQTIIGTITKMEGDKIRLNVAPGKMHRLTFQISDTTAVDVKGSALNLVSAGDEIQTKGRMYMGDGPLASRMLFVSEVNVTKTFTPSVVAAANAPNNK